MYVYLVHALMTSIFVSYRNSRYSFSPLFSLFAFSHFTFSFTSRHYLSHPYHSLSLSHAIVYMFFFITFLLVRAYIDFRRCVFVACIYLIISFALCVYTFEIYIRTRVCQIDKQLTEAGRHGQRLEIRPRRNRMDLCQQDIDSVNSKTSSKTKLER